MMLHVTRGHASAHRLERFWEDPDVETAGLANYADEALRQCEFRRAFDEAPHVPIACTSTA